LDSWLKLVRPLRPSNHKDGSGTSTPDGTPVKELQSFKFQVFEALTVPVLDESCHSTDLRRRQHKDNFLFKEAQDLSKWTEDSHTLASALQKLEELLEGRYHQLQDLINMAVEEATTFLSLLPIFTRRDGALEVGKQMLETAKAQAENTASFAKRWALLHLQMDRIDKVTADYRVKLGQAMTVKAEWRQKSTSLDLELVEALKRIYGRLLVWLFSTLTVRSEPYSCFMDKTLLMQEASEKGAFSPLR
jgi:hypothetical protein